jgi:hypothetical protein
MKPIKACQRCGGTPLHRLGCPVLTGSALVAGGIVAFITAAVAANEATGARGANVILGAAFAIALLMLGFLSWLRRSRFEETSAPKD